MSKNFVWEIGFDFDANADPNNDNLPFLGNDLVRVVDGVSVAMGDPLNLHVGDQISFYVFNATAEASTQNYSIESGLFTFFEADGASTPYPFSQQAAIVADGPGPITLSPNIGSSSATIQIPSLGQAATTAPSFAFQSDLPRWEVISTCLPLAVPGSFEFTFSLTVQGPNGTTGTVTKPFRVDPEMIVEAPPTPAI
jgi:hypothetical protein